jgi:hypothetical protein
VKRYVIAAAIIAMLAGGARAEHEGCRVQGNGSFWEETCTYKARSDSQDVIAATPNVWEVWVVRHNCPVWKPGCEPVLKDGCLPAPTNRCQPYKNSNGQIVTESRKVSLLKSQGPTLVPPAQVHPRVGEQVTVELFATWGFGLRDIEDSVFDGSFGFVQAGPLDGHP